MNVPFPPYAAVARIQNIVAEAYGIDPRMMKYRTHSRYAAWPRQVAIYITRSKTGKSFKAIGQLYGGLDHSTVHYAVRTVEGRMDDSPAYRAVVETISGLVDEVVA